MAPQPPSEADFDILGLDPDAKFSEVRRAYLALVKKWHPDRHHSEPYESQALAEKKFREIDEAYKRISNDRRESSRIPRTPGYGSTQWPGANDARKARAKIHPAAFIRTRSSIRIRPFSGTRIIIPVLLLAATVFILTQFSSFFPDTNVDKSPIQVIEKPTTENQQPLEKPEPKPSEDLVSPVVPASPPSPPALLQSAPPTGFFTLGSTASEVIDAQGPPERVQGQTWTYGLSEINFKNGRVAKYNNFDGSLHVRMLPDASPDRPLPGHITIGSTQDDVLLVQGTPTKVEGNRWFYGFSELIFKNGRVTEYDNYFGNLKVILIPSIPSSPENRLSSFTIGSPSDQVLAVQGTPTSVHGNRWSFNFASVSFRDGKVYDVSDSERQLHFVAPPQISGDEGR